jgi:cytosine/uracil/thiamine/allantoin permease
MEKNVMQNKFSCYDKPRLMSSFVQSKSGGVKKMALIATISSVGTFIACITLALWLIKEVFKSKN